MFVVHIWLLQSSGPYISNVSSCLILSYLIHVVLAAGPLLQVLNEKTKSSRNRLGSFSSSFKEKKEIVRQVFLFTNHILLTTRTSSGRLHLAKVREFYLVKVREVYIAKVRVFYLVKVREFYPGSEGFYQAKVYLAKVRDVTWKSE